MVKITENVHDGILEIKIQEQIESSWKYKIKFSDGSIKMQGIITGYTQRTCLYIGNLKKGQYQFIMNDDDSVLSFNII